MGVYFIDDNFNETEFLKLKLRRVIPFSRFLEQLDTHPSLWFSSPKSWKDPFEARFINVNYETENGITAYPLKNKVFGCCFSTKDVSYEPDWFLYSTDDKSIRIRYNNKIVLNGLKRYSSINSCDIYIGKVKYLSLKKMKDINEILNLNTPSDILKQENLVRLLFVKRRAYKFENELRIIIVLNEPLLKSGFPILFELKERKDLFSYLMFGPTFSYKEFKLWKKTLLEILEQGKTYSEFIKTPKYLGSQKPNRITRTILYHLHSKYKKTIIAH